MDNLLRLRNLILIFIEREQEFIDKAIVSWNNSDYAYHLGQKIAYNDLLSEIDFILDNEVAS